MVSFKVSLKMHILTFIMCFCIYFAMKNCINNLILDILNQNQFVSITGNTYIDFMLNAIIILVPITFVHELLHGGAYRLFGGKVKYGFKGLYAYSQEVSGIILHKTKFLVVLLAPVTVISIIIVLFPSELCSVIFLLNLLGSTGDLLMAAFLCKSPCDSYVADKSYGFDVVDGKCCSQ